MESVLSSMDVVRCCFEKNCSKDLLISLTVCWKGTLAQGSLVSVFVPVGLFLGSHRFDVDLVWGSSSSVKH